MTRILATRTLESKMATKINYDSFPTTKHLGCLEFLFIYDVNMFNMFIHVPPTERRGNTRSIMSKSMKPESNTKRPTTQRATLVRRETCNAVLEKGTALRSLIHI